MFCYSLVVRWEGVSLQAEVAHPQLSSVVDLAEQKDIVLDLHIPRIYYQCLLIEKINYFPVKKHNINLG